MFRGICLAALVIGSSAASPAGAQSALGGQWSFVDDAAFATQVYVIETPTALEFRSRGPVDVFVGYEIDIDSDGVVDVGQDVNYTTSGGAPCTQVRTSATTFSGCGGFASRATYSQEIVGDLKVSRWVIPRTELSRDGQSFRFDVSVYNQSQNLAHHGQGLYRFGVGALPLDAPPVRAEPQPAQAQASAGGRGAPAKPEDAVRFTEAAGLFDALVQRGELTLVAPHGTYRLTSARSAGCRTVLAAGDRRWTIDWRADVADMDTVGSDLAIFRVGGDLMLRPGGQDQAGGLRTLTKIAFNMWVPCT